jgi:D-alanyl-D-alanine-carboxypeptidase/D-alanyl-D-alanine-endopeptidase
MAEAAVQASPVIADGLLYFASDDGYIYAVELQAPRHILATSPDPALLDLYAGPYETGSDFKVTISREGDKLTADILGMGKVELLPLSEARFALGDTPADIEFIRGPDGQCRRAVLRQSGFEVTLTRVR